MKKTILTTVSAFVLLCSSLMAYQYYPYVTENGDVYGIDNDNDGRIETVYVKGHWRDGHYVRSHYRAK